MNGQRLECGFWMALEASPADGHFDICVVREVPRRRVLTLVPHFLRGTQATQPGISMLTTSTRAIKSLEGSFPAQTDGEILSVEDRWRKIELLPRTLNVRTAQEAA
jgi:diacylglycerol kinase family enzyme